MFNKSDLKCGWDTDDAIKYAGNEEWGYSCFNPIKLLITIPFRKD